MPTADTVRPAGHGPSGRTMAGIEPTRARPAYGLGSLGHSPEANETPSWRATWLRRLPPALTDRLRAGYLLADTGAFVLESRAGASLRTGVGSIVGDAKVCHANIGTTASHQARG